MKNGNGENVNFKISRFAKKNVAGLLLGEKNPNAGPTIGPNRAMYKAKYEASRDMNGDYQNHITLPIGTGRIEIKNAVEMFSDMQGVYNTIRNKCIECKNKHIEEREKYDNLKSKFTELNKQLRISEAKKRKMIENYIDVGEADPETRANYTAQMKEEINKANYFRSEAGKVNEKAMDIFTNIRQLEEQTEACERLGKEPEQVIIDNIQRIPELKQASDTNYVFEKMKTSGKRANIFRKDLDSNFKTLTQATQPDQSTALDLVINDEDELAPALAEDQANINRLRAGAKAIDIKKPNFYK